MILIEHPIRVLHRIQDSPDSGKLRPLVKDAKSPDTAAFGAGPNDTQGVFLIDIVRPRT